MRTVNDFLQTPPTIFFSSMFLHARIEWIVWVFVADSSGGHLRQLAYTHFHLSSLFDSDDAFGGNHYDLASAGIAPGPRLSILDLEDSETAKFDATFLFKRVDDSVEDKLNDFLDLYLGHIRRFGNRMGHFLLGQREPPVLSP
jgi:hypothetical protein